MRNDWALPSAGGEVAVAELDKAEGNGLCTLPST